MPTHQESIARIVSTILALDEVTIAAFCKGNPFDKLLRSYDEHNASGKGLYKRKAGHRTYETVLRILQESEVILMTKDEARHLDSPCAKGGLGWKASMPSNGMCRLQAAGIMIAPETATNHL